MHSRCVYESQESARYPHIRTKEPYLSPRDIELFVDEGSESANRFEAFSWRPVLVTRPKSNSTGYLTSTRRLLYRFFGWSEQIVNSRKEAVLHNATYFSVLPQFSTTNEAASVELRTPPTPKNLQNTKPRGH